MSNPIRNLTEAVNAISEGMSLKQMGYNKASDNDINGTSRIGRIQASVRELKAVLGEPHRGKSSDDKVTMEWAFKKKVTEGGGKTYDLVFTVYDYKNPPLNDTTKHTFSVGGKMGTGNGVRKVLGLAGLKMVAEG